MQLQQHDAKRSETSAPEPADCSVVGIFRSLLSNPLQILVRHWNWKSALLSSFLRAFIFLLPNLAAGWSAAAGAVLVEFGMRPLVSGLLGALTQALRFAQPVWLSNLVVMLGFPLIAHAIEFLVHWAHGTPRLAASVGLSMAFSVLSGLLNLYFMRRGILIVGEPDAAPLRTDLLRIPGTFMAFLAAGPRAVCKSTRRAVQGRT